MGSLVRRLRDTQAMAQLIGKSPTFLEVIGQIPAVAKSDATVLITGETGTGKELAARAIHYMSDRAPFPFVPVNCGSLPDSLLEDELFGHERGAFTDAHVQRDGVIAQAHKGTLLLDEVDALTPKGQVALLRVLQDKMFRAIGSSGEQPVDLRVVAITNAPLNDFVRAGTFRADLYYRLCVFSINLPPLRERLEDILPLAHHFLKKHARSGKPTLKLASATCEALGAYDWPGNVRELENAILRAIHLSGTDYCDVEDLGIPHSKGTSHSGNGHDRHTLKASKQRIIAKFERDYLMRLMREHHGNVSRAAMTAGKERRDLGKLLKKYDIDPRLFHMAGAKSPRRSRKDC